MPEDAEGLRRDGRLYIVATPIGNLEDITFRAVRVLGEVEAIACEDTRQTVKLLNRYDLRKRLISYFHPREGRKIPEIIGLLKSGKDVALVSDAGTPGISDPGFPLIREALKEGIVVVPIPGPSAATAALSAAGLPTHRFLFAGFPPPKKEGLRKLLLSLSEEEATLVFYLPTRRMNEFLEAVLGGLGDRRIVIARELTKIHEEFIRGTAGDLLGNLANRPLKGEATVLVEGKR
ncbi:MAG: 16S rRNA (cytidine(1402)-2'-O)-methyltransferase [Acidobacteriota bacterium]